MAPIVRTEAQASFRRTIATALLMAATTMQVLDTTIANVALPYMQGSLGASQDQINWVLTSYIVAAAIAIPPTGWLVARFGRKRLLLIAVAGFTAMSVLCGLSATLSQMVLFRVLQGIFGASLVPLSQAILLDIYPKEKQGMAMGVWGMGVMVGPILGPTIGGWLTETFDWRWVFFINVPIGILTIAGLTSFIDETKRTLDNRFDWFGFATLSVALGALQIGLDRGEQLDWFSSREIIAEFSIAALAFYSFIVHNATAKNPFISLALFKDGNFVSGLMLISLLGVIMMASLALSTPFLQQLMGYPVMTAGIAMSPRGIGTMATMLIAGRLISKGWSKPMIFIGLGLLAHSLYLMTEFTADMPIWNICVTGVEQGLGMGLVFVPLTAITFATLPQHLRTEGAGINTLARNIGGSIGISVIIALLQSNSQVNHSTISAYVTPFNMMLQSGAAASAWNPMTVAGATAIDGQIQRAAMTIAYNNDFKVMMIICLFLMPFLLFVKSPKYTKSDGPAHIVAE